MATLLSTYHTCESLNEFTSGYNSVGYFVKAQVSHLGLTKLFKPVYFKKDEHTVQRSTNDSVERQRVLNLTFCSIELCVEENTILPKISYIIY